MKTILYILVLLISGTALAEENPVRIAMLENIAETPACQAVMREAYRRIDTAVEFRIFSASEALENSNAGHVDAELQRIDGISDKYKNLLQVPIPIYLIRAVAFSTKYRFPVSGWHSLRPYKIGIVKGIVFASQNTADMNVQEYDSYADLVDALADESIDVAVMPRLQGLEARYSRRDLEMTEMEGVLETLFLYHYVHTSRADLVSRLTPVLKDMLLSGETRRIGQSFLADMADQP